MKIYSASHLKGDLLPPEAQQAGCHAFKEWLDKNLQCAASKSARKGHTAKISGPLIQFLDDGRLEIDNNRAERSIKPFVIGRRTGFSPIPQRRKNQRHYLQHCRDRQRERP